jgi:outer membrane protein assembly factor BamB/fibronectin type 3 domain-containing protein
MAPGQYGTGATKEIPPSWDTGKDLPNNAEGYGRVDLEHSLFPGSGYGDDASRLMEVHDVTTGLTTGQTTSYTVTVSNPNDPLIATLVWTDPYGATAAATELVNNLDLKVTSGATTWYPNKKDNTAGSVDTRNNVEQVYISAPSAGTYTVTVAATSVPGNGVSLTNAQPYALVVSGVLAPPCTPPAVPTATASAGPGAATITVSWNTVSGATGYKVYRSDGACPGGAYTLAQTINSGSTTQWADTTVTGGNIYSYKVSSTSACESSQSACSSATAPACSNPTAPGATVTDVSVPNTITLTWTASPTAGVTYTVYRASSCAGPFSAVATGLSALTYSEFDVPGGTTRAYQIAAVDSGCETRNACVTATAGGGPAVYSSALTAKGTPQNTSAGQPVRWIYAAAATSLNPLTLNSAVYAASNDRKLHSMTLGGSGGMWPLTTPKDWKPLVMNAPSQARVPVANLTVDVAGVPTSIRAAVVASQDGRLYLVNADTGALVWSTGVLGDVLQAAPGGYVRAFDPNAVKLANDILIIGTRNSSSANVVYGLNAATGATLWTFTNGGGANALGVINGAVMTDTPNHRVYFATRKNAAGSANTLWCLSFTAASASLVWSADIGNVDSSPILKGTSLYVGNNVGTLYKFDTASGTPSTPLWSYATDDGPVKNYPVVDWSSSAVYASTTNRVWRFVDNGASTTLTWSTPLSGASSIASPSSAMLYATAMYVGTSNGNIVKLTNLTAASPTQTVIPVGNTAIGALAFDYSNNLLHAGSEAGTIYAVTP